MEKTNRIDLSTVYVFTVRGHIVANCTLDQFHYTQRAVESTLRFAWKHEFKRSRSVKYLTYAKVIDFNYE